MTDAVNNIPDLLGEHGVELSTAMPYYTRNSFTNDDPFSAWRRQDGEASANVDSEFYRKLLSLMMGLVKEQSMLRKDKLLKLLDRVDGALALNHCLDSIGKYVKQT